MMEKNQIKVKNLKNDYVTFFTIKGNEVYNRHGKRMYCSCTGNTEETATAMMYNDEEGVYCPHCHEKKVEILQTYEEWKQEQEEKEREQLENIHIVEVGSDWECGFKFYGLSARIDYDSWGKIKHLFRYYRRGWSFECEMEWEYGEPTGWLTQSPEEVEKILIEMGIMKEENTMEAINEKAKKQRIAEENAKKEKEELIDECKDAFKEAEKPSGENNVTGEVIEDPHYPMNIYGGGHWWVIQKEHIWFIRNNGSDGADWSQNNVVTGGAGAIGVRIDYTDELAAKIRSLMG